MDCRFNMLLSTAYFGCENTTLFLSRDGEELSHRAYFVMVPPAKHGWFTIYVPDKHFPRELIQFMRKQSVLPLRLWLADNQEILRQIYDVARKAARIGKTEALVFLESANEVHLLIGCISITIFGQSAERVKVGSLNPETDRMVNRLASYFLPHKLVADAAMLDYGSAVALNAFYNEHHQAFMDVRAWLIENYQSYLE